MVTIKFPIFPKGVITVDLQGFTKDNVALEGMLKACTMVIRKFSKGATTVNHKGFTKSNVTPKEKLR